jgi:hypothetical protein
MDYNQYLITMLYKSLLILAFYGKTCNKTSKKICQIGFFVYFNYNLFAINMMLLLFLSA